jgi:hypothetical protein
MLIQSKKNCTNIILQHAFNTNISAHNAQMLSNACCTNISPVACLLISTCKLLPYISTQTSSSLKEADLKQKKEMENWKYNKKTKQK